MGYCPAIGPRDQRGSEGQKIGFVGTAVTIIWAVDPYDM